MLASLTPTLSVAPAGDPDGDPVAYFFRVSRAADAEGGASAVVAESGNVAATSWQVPVGLLRDGTTYFWHAFSYDGRNYSLPSPAQPLRTDLRLGAHDPSPYDSAGPVTVNLANGNLVFGPDLPQVPTVGGALSVSLVYNSQAGPGAAGGSGLSRGWTISGGDAGFTAVHQSGDGSVTVTDATGALSRFTRTNALGGFWAYAPPDDLPDAVLSGGPGAWTLHDGDGSTYVFGPDDALLTAVSGTDDRHPAAPRMSWGVPAGSPGARLTAVTDPVSGGQLALHYGGGTASGTDQVCGTQVLPAGTARAPAGALCAVDYPDGSRVELLYNPDGLLVRVQSPGPQVWDLRYDSVARLVAVREPLADEWVRAAGSAEGAAARDTDATRTLIDYTTAGRVARVRLADPTPTSSTPNDRPERSYGYPSASSSTVRTAGLSGTRTVTFDPALRTLTDTDPTGVTTTSTWHDDDRPVAVTDGAGRVSTTVYDQRRNPVETYGPAPATGSSGAACFAADANGSGAPTGAAGCPATATLTRSRTDYDQGLTGLAATWWPNSTWTGPPTLHSTFTLDSTGSAGWGSGAPAGLAVSDNYSGRFTGTLTVPGPASSSAQYTLAIDADDAARVYLDDYLVIDRGTGPAGSGQGSAPDVWAGGSTHKIRVDYAEYTGLASMRLTWSTGGSFSPLPAGALTPDYGLPTTSTSPDTGPAGQAPDQVTLSSYDHPENGLVSAVTVDPARADDPNGLALTSRTGYENPGQGYLRRTSRALPSGAASSYSYYGDTETARDPCNPAAPPVNQAGRTRSTLNPADSTGSRWSQSSVYDLLGRPVASWWNAETTPTCTRYDSQGRPVQVVTAKGSPGQRTVSTDYAVGGDPLVSAVTDSASTGSRTVTTRIDLLGRVVGYTDVYDTSTLSSYDQAGRLVATSTSTHSQTPDPTGPGVTVGPVTGSRSETFSYDDGGRLLGYTQNGVRLATASYSRGELSGVRYANGTSLSALVRDGAGRLTSEQFTFAPAGQQLSDGVVRSFTGRVLRQVTSMSGQPSRQWDVGYDGGGRLVFAVLRSNDRIVHQLDYAFGSAGPATCPTGASSTALAGRDSNRTQLTDSYTDPTSPVGTGPVTVRTDSCYDAADRLLSTASSGGTGGGAGGTSGSAGYDAHGNTVRLGGQRLGYDSDNRTSTLDDGQGTAVGYTRDSTDRIVARTATSTGPAGGSGPGGAEPGSQAFSFTGGGDSPDLTLDPVSHAILDSVVVLPGGVSLTQRPGQSGPAGQVWAYPNLHGDLAVSAGADGAPTGPGYSYDPVRPAAGPHHPCREHCGGGRRGPGHHHRAAGLRLAGQPPARVRARRDARPHPDGSAPVQPGPGPLPDRRPGRGRQRQQLRLHQRRPRQPVRPKRTGLELEDLAEVLPLLGSLPKPQ